MSGAYRSRRGASRTTINEDTDSSEEESDGGSRPSTPRTRHSVAKKNAEQLTLQLLTHLERHKIDGMHSRFQEHDLRVSMLDFVRIMRDALPNYIVSKPGEQGKKKSAAELAGLRILDDEEDLLRNLLELYREIDVNGDGDVEWEEFIRFIVDKVSDSAYLEAASTWETGPAHAVEVSRPRVDGVEFNTGISLVLRRARLTVFINTGPGLQGDGPAGHDT